MSANFRGGRRAYLKLSRTGSTQIMSSGLDTGDLQRIADAYEVTHWGQDDKNFIAGLRSATFKIGGPWASTYEAFLSGSLGSSNLVAIDYGPESTASGRIRLKANAVLINYDLQTPVGGRAVWTGDLQLSGSVTSTKF